MRKRMIAKRKKQLDMVDWPYSIRPVDGKLANHSALTCPDGKHCMICHPGKYPRIETVQEKRSEDIKDQLED